MTKANNIRCRVVACPEAFEDGKSWSFYLINDSDEVLDVAVLETFGHEWGDFGNSVHPEVKVTDLAPGNNALIWRDDDEELRMWCTLKVQVAAREAELLFEFPILYKRRSGGLPVVQSLGKPGFAVAAAP
jgi:hypothetical protein